MHLAPLAAVGADGGAPVVLAGVPDCRYTGRQMPVVFLITVTVLAVASFTVMLAPPQWRSHSECGHAGRCPCPRVLAIVLADARAPQVRAVALASCT